MNVSLIRARSISWLIADYLHNAKNPTASRAKYLESQFEKLSLERLQRLVDKTPTSDERSTAYEMANYLIEFERDDFYFYCDEPSADHIYYKAFKFLNGTLEATNEIHQAKEGRK